MSAISLADDELSKLKINRIIHPTHVMFTVFSAWRRKGHCLTPGRMPELIESITRFLNFSHSLVLQVNDQCTSNYMYARA